MIRLGKIAEWFHVAFVVVMNLLFSMIEERGDGVMAFQKYSREN